MAGVILLPTERADAESRPTTSCRFEPAGTGKVRTVTDGRSFTLEDGREIRLAGIEVPLPPGPGDLGTGAKAALAANTVTWAREFAPFGVRVAAVAPGMIDTPMTRGMNPKAREALLKSERGAFLAEDWPRIRRHIDRLGLSPADLFAAADA